MTYIDAYLLAVAKDKVDAYRDLARRSAPLWEEFGAIGYLECLADDAPYGELTSFPRAVMARDDETVVLSWIMYPSREARDTGSKAAMSDPRMAEMMQTMPVDGKRMIFGGFAPIVEHQLGAEGVGYVDGFVTSAPRSRLHEYKDLANLGAQVWTDHGALSYVECMADDVPYGELTSFPRAVQAGPDDVVFFSWATYRDRETRDAVGRKVMADPRLSGDMDKMPFNAKTMIYGGFVPIVLG